LARAFASILARRQIEVDDQDILRRYARHEARAQAGPYASYRAIMASSLRGVAGELGVEPTEAELETFCASLADWPAFADSTASLRLLGQRFRLGVITNCDDDLFAASSRRLGVEFDCVVTAQQVGSYKPDERNFLAAFARLGLPVERILHVAQSLYHDHVPANRLGLSSVFIDRRHGRDGSGATAPARASPDATFPDLASFAAAATA